MMRLSESALPALAEGVQHPRYTPADHGAGIVHLGLGAFHKAHQAMYTDDVLALTGGDWRIVGVSLRSAATRDALREQDALYTVGIRQSDQEQLRVIAALANVLVAPESPGAVLDWLSSESIHCVTLTITEKGYCLDPATGQLDLQHPDVVADLAQPASPRSAIGYLCEAIRRRAADQRPLNVISCDNLAGNGKKLRAAVLALLQLQSPQWVDWCIRHVAFPSTMVDRIVPAVTSEVIDQTAQSLGVIDAACVKTETFSQWVIEDSFSAPRPAWECAGALIVDDVHIYETNKLRLLNGPHSATAYLGLLAGFEYVHEAVAADWYRHWLEYLMREMIIPELVAPAGFDLAAYAGQLRQRFANHSLNHRLDQIAMDGSQKLAQRIFPLIKTRLEHQRPITPLVSVIAAWLLLMRRGGIADPKSAALQNAFNGLSGEALADAALADELNLFDRELIASKLFRTELNQQLTELEGNSPEQLLIKQIPSASQ